MSLQFDGTVVVERKDANAAFYGESVSAKDILAGKVPSQGPEGMWPVAANGLFLALNSAEGGRRLSSWQTGQQRSLQSGQLTGLIGSVASGSTPLSNGTPVDSIAPGLNHSLQNTGSVSNSAPSPVYRSGEEQAAVEHAASPENKRAEHV